MIIGLDFYDTITMEERRFKKLTDSLVTGGAEVYIISAIKQENLKRLQKDFRKSHNIGVLHPVFFENYGQVPKLKYQACKELGVDFMIDDRIDVCQYIAAHGIPTLHFRA